MIALTDERKEQILNEQRGGLWVVLDDEYPRDLPTAADVLGGDLDEP